MNRILKAKKCVCGDSFTPKVPLQKYCTQSCLQKHRSGKLEIDQMRQLHVTVLFQAARSTFQAWVRKRDEGKPCIACGKMFKKGDVIHGSHFFKAETHSWLIFDEDNCHGSCDYCNVTLEGNLLAYAANLPLRIGEESFKALCYKGQRKQYTKHSKDELIDIIIKYK